MSFISLPLLPIVVAAISSLVLGSLWYSPLLFGKMWISLVGFSAKELEEMKAKGMGKTYFVAFLNSGLMAYVLSLFLHHSNVDSLYSGMMMAFFLWLGFIATTTLGSILWEDKPVKLYLLNNAYSLVNLLIMTVILISL